MNEKWHKIKEMIDREVDDVVRVGKLDKDIVTSLVMMYELCDKLSGGSSYDGYSRDRGSYGHEQVSRNSRDGYSNEQWGNSRDSSREEMRHHLEKAFQAAGSNAERDEIRRLMMR
ncbi:MAG: hypothetical protein IJP92_14175 [Lachnospiraceae bacterium]|nr:hypothetical protein [Lachnospiraceae bacterium]